jgi:replication-associated recombination protein RarA
MSPTYRIGELTTMRGYKVDECVSALQKAIRRGHEAEAIWWAAELDRSGHSSMVWSRLMVITSEDVGLAEPIAPAVVEGLHSMYDRLKAKRNRARPERLAIVHAAAYLAGCPKSRRLDEAAWWAYGATELRYDVPDYALDMHTSRGRRMGRGERHFAEEASRLNDEVELGRNPYRYAYEHEGSEAEYEKQRAASRPPKPDHLPLPPCEQES